MLRPARIGLLLFTLLCLAAPAAAQSLILDRGQRGIEVVAGGSPLSVALGAQLFVDNCEGDDDDVTDTQSYLARSLGLTVTTRLATDAKSWLQFTMEEQAFRSETGC